MRFRPSWFDTDFARLKVNSCPFEPQDFVWPETHKSTKNKPT
jgi:DNA ligase-associated metallophosphoesterase